MDAGGDKVLKRLVNHAMAHYRRFAAEMRADHADGDMAAAGIAGMPGVQGAVIADIQAQRLQRGEALADFFFEAGVQAGRVLRNGLTVTLENTPPLT